VEGVKKSYGCLAEGIEGIWACSSRQELPDSSGKVTLSVHRGNYSGNYSGGLQVIFEDVFTIESRRDRSSPAVSMSGGQ
jgi:hypothetical protein